MGNSMESERPIMAPSLTSHRASKRFSTFSGTPSFAASEATTTTMTTTTGDPRYQEIKEYSTGLERLNSKRLQQQRYNASAEKSDELAKLALGAKVERALERRMSGQDAVMRPRPRPRGIPLIINEKSG